MIQVMILNQEWTQHMCFGNVEYFFKIIIIILVPACENVAFPVFLHIRIVFYKKIKATTREI